MRDTTSPNTKDWFAASSFAHQPYLKVLWAVSKNIVEGTIGAYTEMCEQACQQAYDLMLKHAEGLGANAIVGVSYDASEADSKDSCTEVLCYGTAVVIQKI